MGHTIEGRGARKQGGGTVKEQRGGRGGSTQGGVNFLVPGLLSAEKLIKNGRKRGLAT